MRAITAGTAEGVRERKRRETRQRIAETALRLFLANGYENTSLDTIAAEAGISRRTFFSYFKSKEDILFVWQSGGGALCGKICATCHRTSTRWTPRVTSL